MIRLLTFMTCTAVLMTLLVMSLTEAPILNELSRPGDVPVNVPVAMLCAASNREVIESIVTDYRQISDDRIELQFGPSQTLASGLEVTDSGDLFLPADESYLHDLVRKRIVVEVMPIARMKVVLAVKKGNPLGISCLQDLMRKEIRLVQANPDLAAVGKLTRDALNEHGKWEALADATDAFVSTVTEAGNSLAIGAADAAIIYDVVAHGKPDFEIIAVEELDDVYADVSIGVTKAGKKKEQVRQFLQFIAAPEWGRKRYNQFGFTPCEEFYWNESAGP